MPDLRRAPDDHGADRLPQLLRVPRPQTEERDRETKAADGGNRRHRVKRKLGSRRQFLLIDVREPQEHGSRTSPREVDPAGEFPKRVGELDREVEIVIHCKSECAATRLVASCARPGSARPQHEGRHSGLEQPGGPERAEILTVSRGVAAGSQRRKPFSAALAGVVRVFRGFARRVPWSQGTCGPFRKERNTA